MICVNYETKGSYSLNGIQPGAALAVGLAGACICAGILPLHGCGLALHLLTSFRSLSGEQISWLLIDVSARPLPQCYYAFCVVMSHHIKSCRTQVHTPRCAMGLRLSTQTAILLVFSTASYRHDMCCEVQALVNPKANQTTREVPMLF